MTEQICVNCGQYVTAAIVCGGVNTVPEVRYQSVRPRPLRAIGRHPASVTRPSA
jgi:hypothetical protein